MKPLALFAFLVSSLVGSASWSMIPANQNRNVRLTWETAKPGSISALSRGKNLKKDDNLVEFDYPIEYNREVQYWVKYYQSIGKKVFTTWLKRSSRHLPLIKKVLKREGLPEDLAYMAMIESGFSYHAVSQASAVGPWQFMRETGDRFGLRTSWWLDERKDLDKSTKAAAKYLRRLYSMFGNWYLVAAAYNSGENRIQRVISRYGTRNFWTIAKQGGFADETREYVPKLIACMLIAKSPEIYGFDDAGGHEPLKFEHFQVPGGTRLDDLAYFLGVTKTYLRDLNPELIRGYVPVHVNHRMIRIPEGTSETVSRIIRNRLISFNENF